MRIAFNGQRLVGQRLGVGRYIEYLLRYWTEFLLPADDVQLFLRRPLEERSRQYLDLPPAIKPTVLASRLPGIPWENIHLRRAASSADVLFCPAYTAPVGYRKPFVVATHSANEADAGAHSWRYRQTYGRLNGHIARSADHVIVPGAATREDVIRLYGVARERISVIAQGTDDAFVPMEDAGALESVRRRFFGDARPYVLFVGKCSARRNVPLLLEAFARARRDHDLPHGLVLFGPNVAGLPLDEMAHDLGISEDFVQEDGNVVDHRELVPIYNAADVFVSPSPHEGWSMTTVEALGCGTAVIAADRGGLSDVVAGHGLMLRELSAETLAEAIARVLTDDALRHDLECSAATRGKALRWQDTAAQTLDVLRSVANRK